jgi:uncharacterized protein (DUF1684 family)
MLYIRFATLIICLLLLSCSTSKQFSTEDYREYISEHKIGLTEGERAPLGKEDLSFIRFYEYDPGYRVSSQFQTIKNGEVFDMATYSGMTKSYKKVGKLIFKLHDKSHKLYLYQNVKFANHPEYGQYYFLPFKDLSNGMETYGGGRYLDIRKKDLKSNHVIDFNLAYNPWCAYSDGYNCPVPPVENHLNTKISAGEKNYSGKIKE